MTAQSAPATFCEAVAETPAGSPPTGPRAQPESRGSSLRRLTRLLRRVPKNGSCYDPRFERPDLVENDYYRFRNQPRGW